MQNRQWGFSYMLSDGAAEEVIFTLACCNIVLSITVFTVTIIMGQHTQLLNVVNIVQVRQHSSVTLLQSNWVLARC